MFEIAGGGGGVNKKNNVRALYKHCISYEWTLYIVDPCESIPCQNNGICTAFKDKTGFKCTCDEKHNGTFCEESKFEVAILNIKCLI